MWRSYAGRCNAGHDGADKLVVRRAGARLTRGNTMTISTMLTGAAGRALRTLQPLETVAAGDRTAAKVLINSARDDIGKALGAGRRSSFSAELHAAAGNLHGGVGNGATDIAAGLGELAAAGRRTAATRVTIGAVGVGAGIAGVASLAIRNSEPVIMAPGAPGTGHSAASSE